MTTTTQEENMPTPVNDPPPPTFGAYAARRLCNPLDAAALAFVYGLFLLVGGWMPLAAGHVVFKTALAGACRWLPGCAWMDRGPAASAFSTGLPAVLLFAALLRCDYDRLLGAWRAAARAPSASTPP